MVRLFMFHRIQNASFLRSESVKMVFLLQSRACFSSGVRRRLKTKHEAEFRDDMWAIKDLMDEPVFLVRLR